MLGSARQYQTSRWCDNDGPVGKCLDHFSLSRRQACQWHMDRGSASNHTEGGVRGRLRQFDRAYAVETPRPSRQIADMPNLAMSSDRGQELVHKIEQQLDSICRRYRDAQGVAADQHPAVIMVNGSIPKIKRRFTHVAATVIERKKKPARQPRE